MQVFPNYTQAPVRGGLRNTVALRVDSSKPHGSRALRVPHCPQAAREERKSRPQSDCGKVEGAHAGTCGDAHAIDHREANRKAYPEAPSDSEPGRTARAVDCAGGGRTHAAAPQPDAQGAGDLLCAGQRRAGRGDILCALRLPDYPAAAAGAGTARLRQPAQLLRAARLPDTAAAVSVHRLHGRAGGVETPAGDGLAGTDHRADLHTQLRSRNGPVGV